jgi:hypothetical protein
MRSVTLSAETESVACSNIMRGPDELFDHTGIEPTQGFSSDCEIMPTGIE